MSTSLLFNTADGIPGEVSRGLESSIEQANILALAGVYPQAYGAPMVYGSGGIQNWAAGNVAADFAGILVRSVPSVSGFPTTGSSVNPEGLSIDIPNPLQVQGLLVRGYTSVKCTLGTPVRGGVVYVRITFVAASGNTPAKNIGDLEATSDTGNNVALTTTQATWAKDGVDAYLNAEIRVAR